LLITSPTLTAEICDISKDPSYANSDINLLGDQDFSESAVLESISSLENYLTNKSHDKYFIPENHFIIINGGYLLAIAKLNKSKLEVIGEDETYYLKWKINFLSATEKYCEYRRTHFLKDW